MFYIIDLVHHGLSEWFADNVNMKNNVLTFYWEGSEESYYSKKEKGCLFNING